MCRQTGLAPHITADITYIGANRTLRWADASALAPAVLRRGYEPCRGYLGF